MCKMLAPASTALRPSSAISSGVYGMYGHCFLLASTPVSEADMITFFMFFCFTAETRRFREGRKELFQNHLHPFYDYFLFIRIFFSFSFAFFATS